MEIKVASTSITKNVMIYRSDTGAPLTGLAYNTASLTAYYVLPRAASVAITLATQTVTGAYSSGGFVEIDATNCPGLYRLDIPNAALASGRFSNIHLQGAANMAPCVIEIELTGWDNQDGVRGGMTALPNAAAEAAGGLYTRGTGAGQINQTNNGQIDANAARLGGTTCTGRDIGASVLLSSGTGTGQVTLTSGRVNADITHIAASAVSTSTAQLGVNVVNFGGSAGTFASGRPEVNTTHAAGTAWGSGAITAASIAASALNGKGDWNIGKTGYALSSAGIQAIWDALTSALTTASSIGKLLVDNVNATISSRLASASYTAPLDAAATATAVWNAATASYGSAGSYGLLIETNLDGTVSSRLASASYTAPLDAAGTRSAVGLASANLDTQLSGINSKTTNLPASPAATGDAMTLTSAYDFAKGTVAMTESYAAKGATMTPAQALYQINQHLSENSVSGTTMTLKKRDNSTTAKTFTLDDATSPTSITETT